MLEDPAPSAALRRDGLTDTRYPVGITLSRGASWLLWLRHLRCPLRHSRPQAARHVASFALWTTLAVAIGTVAGLLSAGFLQALDLVTQQYAQTSWLLWGLPLVGFAVGWLYHRYGGAANAGTEAVVAELRRPRARLPWQMAPLVLLGTLATHLCGGSVGREGTAIQMSVALSDRWTAWLGLRGWDRSTVLSMGISAGFAGLFGTPWAAAIFAVELPATGKPGNVRRARATIPRAIAGLAAALIADAVCRATGVPHAHYELGAMAPWGLVNGGLANLGWAATFGLLCGIVAIAYRWLYATFKSLFRSWVSYPPLRPLCGGCLVIVLVAMLGTTRYNGLGLPVIEQAFVEPIEGTAFLWKTVLTSLTLGAGFKGGEVTPLFFIGATLGNAAHAFLPLPLGLLAAMGFVAVFAGVTRTPWACSLMGCELFGVQAAPFLTIGCFAATHASRLIKSLARLSI